MSVEIEKMLHEYAAAWSCQNIDRICEFFVDDCRFEDVPTAETATGKAELRGFLEAVFDAVPDFKMELTNVRVSDRFAVTEWGQKGTLVKDFGPIKATNQPYLTRSATVFELDGRKIRRASDYFDVYGPLKAAGAIG